MYQNRLPLVPPDILQAHMVHEPGDTRFKAAARLLQALWRAERGIPMGIHAQANGEPRKLGSRIEASYAKQGANFLSPAITKATLNKPSKISAQTWMTQFFGLLCLSRGPFGQFAGR